MKGLPLILGLLLIAMLLMPRHLRGQATPAAAVPAHDPVIQPMPSATVPIIVVEDREGGIDLWSPNAELIQTESAAPSPDEIDLYRAEAADDLGDWSNTAALACILPLGATLNVSFPLTFLPPPSDYPPSAANYLANLGLKYCAPYLEPPTTRTVTNVANCRAGFNQTDMSGNYSNLFGFPSPLSQIFPWTDWGQLGTPQVVHWSTDVAVSARHNGQFNGSQIAFPTGINPVIWRGETLIHFMDYVFIYIPGLGQDREKLRTALSVTKFLGDKALRFLIAAEPNPHGIYNEEYQYVVVTDFVKPTISTSTANVTIEAIEPGGVSRRTYLPVLEKTITYSDDCDPHPLLRSTNAPDFARVNESYAITWEVRDRGPHSLQGGFNATTLQQTVTVVDTLPPIILAPPPIVVESAAIPATIDLGHPAVFDLADLDPAVSHNACSRPGVVCSGDQLRFPAGKTTVTWTANDSAGNSASAAQLVNVKSPGTNKSPIALSQTGDDAPAAVAYEPITITLTAGDPDQDPLWFRLDTQPENGFFHAPLYPTFIQDYRVEANGIVLHEYCDEHRGEYVYTNWPVEAQWMAVDDDDNVYVFDNGTVYCQSADGSVSQEHRIARIKPDGTYIQTGPSAVPDSTNSIYIDYRLGHILAADPGDNHGNPWVHQFDLETLETVGHYRVDYATYPSGTINDLDSADYAVADEQGILYIGGFNRLWLFDTNFPITSGNSPLDGLVMYRQFDTEINGLAIDSGRNLYVSEGNRVYKWSPATLDADHNFAPGAFVGWLGRCHSGPGCDVAHQRSFGFSCTDATCGVVAGQTHGSGPGQFAGPRAIALDGNDILYVTDYFNRRVQRFTLEGHFAGQAISECDGSCFVLGDFGLPRQVTVNSTHFYVLDDNSDLLHVFETTPLEPLSPTSARIIYQSENNFVGTDSFTFGVTDGLATSPPATVEIDVGRNYRPPQADEGLAFAGHEDTPTAVTLSGYDPDEALDTLTFRIETPPTLGTITGSGANRAYTPNPDYNGIDSFTFVTGDGRFTSAPQTVMIALAPTPDAPRFPEENQNFVYRLSGGTLDLNRLSTLENLQVGRGFNTMFKVDYYDPDIPDRHMVTVNWGDGSTVEPEGKILEDGTVTGPILSQSGGGAGAGGYGTVTAEHTFNQNGNYNIQICITDQVVVDGGGNKSPSAASQTRCKTIPVTVSTRVDLLLDIDESSSPVAVGQSLVYTLSLRNNPPETGTGLTATGLIISVTLDARVNYVSAAGVAGICTHATGVVTCPMNALQAGETAEVRINVMPGSGLEPGDRLETVASLQVAQAGQAETVAFALTTVVAPADFIVNTISDEPDAGSSDGECRTAGGACSLRAAVEQANAAPGRRIIALDFATYPLDAPLVISGDVTINGLGQGETILAGQGNGRVLTVESGAVVILNDLTLTRGTEPAGVGGGLLNAGTIALSGVTVSHNEALSGGGIWNQGSLTATTSAIVGNRSNGGSGGGLHNQGTATLTNATISGNRAGSGGGIGGGTNTLTYVTVSGNHATGSGGGLNGGPADFTLSNTILAGNTAAVAGSDCGYGFTSQGYNLIGNTNGCAAGGSTTGNITGQAPRLSPLSSDNGAPPTQALRGGSPAIDAGTCQAAVDQRGTGRPVDGNLDGQPRCDIGAYEFEPVRLYLPVAVR